VPARSGASVSDTPAARTLIITSFGSRLGIVDVHHLQDLGPAKVIDNDALHGYHLALVHLDAICSGTLQRDRPYVTFSVFVLDDAGSGRLACAHAESEERMVTAGFIGLGSQGAGMAQRIIAQGVPTTLWARREAALAPLAGTATFARDPVELGRASDVVGICVTDGDAVRAVCLGPAGVIAGMAEGSVLALHSTIGTDDCAEIARAAAARAVRVIDAPVSGGGAVAGRLTVYVGGPEEAVAFARPVLETYGDPVFHMGGLGSGLRTKVLNNALNAAHFALAHDAFEIGTELGLDPDLLAEALRSGSGRSFSLEVFTRLRSFDLIAAQVGPIMAKDVGLFAAETEPVADRAMLLASADRFLALLGHPRAVASGGGR
jgi:3-hydroxyisobutyrate dehydrogenase